MHYELKLNNRIEHIGIAASKKIFAKSNFLRKVWPTKPPYCTKLNPYTYFFL